MSKKLDIFPETRHLRSPITCLEFVEGFVLAGEGPFIRIYCSNSADNTEWVNIGNYTVFKSVSIHIMKVDISGIVSQNLGVKVCAVGGRCIRIMQINLRPVFSIEFVSSIYTFQDWIWDARWFSTNKLILLMAQNYVLVWDSFESKMLQKYHCEVKCILYCGSLISADLPAGIIMSGTVFKEVLIWSPACFGEKLDCCTVLHRLLGHEGVIFSIHYNEGVRKLCTSSDDRSVHIWKHNLSSDRRRINDKLTVADWKSSTFTLLGKLFGHDSRVCKAIIVSEQCCVSAGEDSTLCLWKSDEIASDNFKLAKKVSCHSGSAIRSLCLDSEKKSIFTGGDDGGLKLWPLFIEKHNTLKKDTFLLNADFADGKEQPRELQLLDDKHMLILTDIGRLLCHNLSSKKTRMWLKDIKVKSENVLDVFLFTEGSSLIAFGDLHGNVTVFKTYYSSGDLEFQVIGHFICCEGKVFTVKWVERFQLLTCGVNGQMTLWNVENFEINGIAELVAKFELPHCKHRWVSAAKIIRKFKSRLICGSRGGSLYVYDLPFINENDATIQPAQSFSRLHGSHGVSSIYTAGDFDQIYTTGRDGTMTTFELNPFGLTQMHKIRVPGCPRWISGAIKCGSDLLVYGFHDERFILWSEQNQTVLAEILCGGGHRSWGLHFTKRSFTFVYIKEGDVGIVTRDIEFAFPISIKLGNHIRQINMVKHLFTNGSKSYFATASEDNTIKIWSADMKMSADKINLEQSLKCHISSVKTMDLCPLLNSNVKSKDYLLVTAGGRAQIVCWKLSLDSDDENKLKSQHLVTFMLNRESCQSRKPWIDQSFTVDPETRFMDIAIWKVNSCEEPYKDSVFIIAVACSDSFIRYYSYNLMINQVTFWLQHCPHGQHCILKIFYHFFNRIQRAVLITAATDGQIIILDITQLERKILRLEKILNAPSMEYGDGFQYNQDEHELKSVVENSISEKLRVHQSGITALSVRIEENSNGNDRLIFASGGDDTAVQLVTVTLCSQRDLVNKSTDDSKSSFIDKIEKAAVSGGHSAQVTGIALLASDLVVTTSVDQRISIWVLSGSPQESKKLKLISSSYSNVADTSSMTIWTDRDNERRYLCIVGKGIGIFELVNR